MTQETHKIHRDFSKKNQLTQLDEKTPSNQKQQIPSKATVANKQGLVQKIGPGSASILSDFNQSPIQPENVRQNPGSDQKNFKKTVNRQQPFKKSDSEFIVNQLIKNSVIGDSSYLKRSVIKPEVDLSDYYTKKNSQDYEITDTQSYTMSKRNSLFKRQKESVIMQMSSRINPAKPRIANRAPQKNSVANSLREAHNTKSDQLKTKKQQILDFFEHKRVVEYQDFSRDYIGLLNSLKIKNYLKDNNLPEKIFSDNVFMYNRKQKKSRYIFMVTYKGLNILSPGSLSVKRSLAFEDIQEVGFCEQNAVMVSFHSKNKFDLLLESYKRFEMVRFILSIYGQVLKKKVNLGYKKE